MDDIKITIKWNGNTITLHTDPITAHVAEKADLTKLIGAAIGAMGQTEPQEEEDNFLRIMPKDGRVVIKSPSGEERSFVTFRQALDWIANDYRKV